ncbi:MAG: hypothetical protein A2486_15030 [Burkholderiales bacterium RIFOXYC12_FULL_65_23]|uniref:DUF4139 domain-containing protein n=1 Tax=Malikia spinosa TaxID=86180 RepID=UPI0008CFD0EA|nr:MAG: hypothetical protein A2486_15030 [Burkholderiales bacterium RIFOXYC12_FULL_65_23]
MKTILSVAAALAVTSTAWAQEPGTFSAGPAERSSIALTLYQEDLALVRELRQLQLPGGLVRLDLSEVPAQLRPETTQLRWSGGGPVNLLEQSFDAKLLTAQQLLESHLGREVTLLREHPVTGALQRESATVLAAGNDNGAGAVLRFADRIETMPASPGWRLAFDRLPADLHPRPTLSLLLDSAAGPRSLELSYLSGGLSWKTDYVARLSTDGRQMDLSGWVTLSNRSGTSYRDARLQLVAGALNRVQESAPLMVRKASVTAMRASSAPVEESLLDYHLYRFERPLSIADQQTKQLSLLTATAVPVRREYLLADTGALEFGRQDPGVQQFKPSVWLEFDNRGGALGQPLPAGVVRFYAPDRQGEAQFVGEDRINHSARDETIRLRLGSAFDLSAERRQMSFRQLGERSSESGWRMTLRNARDEAVTIRVQQALAGDWEMVQESQRSSKPSAQSASWQVEVPARGSAQLDYTIRTRW